MIDTTEHGIERRPVGVRHDGQGRYALSTYYTTDAGRIAVALAADPGHAHVLYEYRASGCANWCRTADEARRLARRSAR